MNDDDGYRQRGKCSVRLASPLTSLHSLYHTASYKGGNTVFLFDELQKLANETELVPSVMYVYGMSPRWVFICYCDVRCFENPMMS